MSHLKLLSGEINKVIRILYEITAHTGIGHVEAERAFRCALELLSYVREQLTN